VKQETKYFIPEYVHAGVVLSLLPKEYREDAEQFLYKYGADSFLERYDRITYNPIVKQKDFIDSNVRLNRRDVELYLKRKEQGFPNE
jgi:hypothetical protein